MNIPCVSFKRSAGHIVRAILLRVVVYGGIVWALASLTNPVPCSHGPHRAMLARAKNDMRNMATAIEAYHQDHGSFPVQVPLPTFARDDKERQELKGLELFTAEPGGQHMHDLTTPVAYLPAIPVDVYSPSKHLPYSYFTDGQSWLLYSAGPDGRFDLVPVQDFDSVTTQPSERIVSKSHDPTNGTLSAGDVWRVRR